MKEKLILLIDEVVSELYQKSKDFPEDRAYPLIYKQLEFIKDCVLNNKSIINELNGRELNFNVVASRNFAGPEERLEKKIGEIVILLREFD
jgi:hypothetical protein